MKYRMKFKDSSVLEMLKKRTNNFTKPFSGSIVVEGKDLTEAVRILQKYYVDVYWDKLPPITPSHPSGKRVPQYEIYGDTLKDKKVEDKDPRPVSEVAEHLSIWIDAFLDNDDELSEEYEKPFRNIQKDKRLLNKVANELKTQFDALDLDLNNLEDAPDISRIIWKEMKRFTRR